jgi:hypothetical protein
MLFRYHGYYEDFQDKESWKSQGKDRRTNNVLLFGAAIGYQILLRGGEEGEGEE